MQVTPRAGRHRRSRCRSSRWPRCSPPPGVIRVDTVAQMFDVGTLLAHQPLPAGDAGRRSSATPPRSACWSPTPSWSRGWSWPARSRSTSAPAARPRTSAPRCRRRVDDDGVDAVVAVFLPPLMAGSTEFGPALRDVARTLGQADRRRASCPPRASRRSSPSSTSTACRPAGSVPVVLHAGAGGHRAGEGRRVRRAGGAARSASCPSCPTSTRTPPAALVRAGAGRRPGRAGSSPTTS